MPASPVTRRASHRGIRRGRLAPIVSASSGSHCAPGPARRRDVEDTGRARLESEDRRGRGIVEMDEGRDAAVVAHDREPAGADELELRVVGRSGTWSG